MMVNQQFLSSSKNWHWETPPKLWNRLSMIFNFVLDAAADERNYKCKRYFNDEDDALSRDWVVAEGEQWWLNPPWGNLYTKETGRGVEDWMGHALKQYRKGYEGVLVISARMGARWFHNYCLEAPYYLFPKGRVKFIDPDTKKVGKQPTFPSVLIIYVDNLTNEQIKRLKNIGWLVSTVTLRTLVNEESNTDAFRGYGQVQYDL